MSHDAQQIGRSGTPYERAVAHLKRSEHAQAIAQFTEAIRLDPESPNAYVGRALALRSLGDEAAALRDEEAARALGGPVRSVWDRFVNRGYRRWRGDLRDPAWRRDDPLSRDAVLLRQWTWQIYNGGLPQWVANGNGEWAEELAQAAEHVGSDAARAVAATVRDVAAILEQWPNARATMFQMIAAGSALNDQEQQMFSALAHCEASYLQVGHRFAADIEAWLDKQADTAT